MPDDNAGDRCPIDFDHHSPEHAKIWPQVYQRLRATSPRPWTEAHGGYWVATRYQDIIRIGQNPDLFFTTKTVDSETGKVVKGGSGLPALAEFDSIPNESDPPEWNLMRNFLNHRFGPKATEGHRARAKIFAAALVDNVIETGRFDIVDDLSSPLPALVTLDLFGFPLSDWRRFADPFHRMVYTRANDPAFPELIKGLDFYKQRLEEELALRRKEPKDDLLGYLINGRINGEPLPEHQIHAIAFNVLAGGVDTTTGLTANTLLHFARNPDQRQQLIDHPEMLPLAREECLRYFSPIHGTARSVKRDMEFAGWGLKENDRILLCYASANRDEDIFKDPESLRIDRTPNRHIAFGAGLHRCIGSFFARMMFEVMVREVLARMPDYKVDEENIRPYGSVGDINGWVTIPATFSPGKRVGASIPGYPLS